MRVCPLCMRELLPSDTTCPDDGAVPVEAADQGDSGAPTVPRARRLGSSEVDTSPVTPAPLADQLEPGTMLGKAYRVERLIGHGGMGAVYEVEHLRLQKRFAAKVLRHEYAQDTTALARFERMVDPWLARLERIVRPRMTAVLDHPLATIFTGLLLLLLGLLLALPIPLTNYVFGGLILLYALALLERDGALMLAAWGLGIVALVTTGALSGGLITALQGWIDTTF